MSEHNLANHPAQRVGIFIDTQNLYHSAKANYRSNVNYEEVIKRAVNGRRLIRAFAYVIKSEHTDESKFFDALADIGIEIRVKDIQIFYTGEKKADWDVGIAVDIIRMTEKLDTVVLVSGDGDFVEVVKYVKSRGVRAEIMAFRKTTSLKLVEEADFFYDLGAEPDIFLIRSKPGTRTRKLSLGAAYPSSNPIQPYQSPTSPYTDDLYRPVAPSPLTDSLIQSNTSNSSTKSQIVSSPNAPLRSSSFIKEAELYGKKVNRNVKPVIGMPVRKNHQNSNKNSSSARYNSSGLENAFGNTRRKNIDKS